MGTFPKVIIISLLFALSACANVGNRDDEEAEPYNKISDVINGKPKPARPLPQARYCYQTYEDFICYGKPLPGEEARLVGYQDVAGHTGYVMDPSHIINGDATKPLPPLKAVNVNPPTPVKSDSDKKLKEIIFDPAELEPKTLVPDKPQ